MGTLAGGYHLKDGTRVPSVTTIIGRFKESGALINWAAGQSAEYILRNLSAEPTREEITKLCGLAKGAYREVRDEAGAIGTIAHGMIEADILGKPVTVEGSPERVAKARSAYEAYCAWAGNQNIEFIWTERPMVSELHRFGGTPDALAKIGNRVVLLDWKSSNSVYADYLLQIAAYGKLVEETEGISVDGYYLCRFAKTNADFSAHYFPELSDAWRMFELLRECYEIDKELKKRAA